MTDSLKRKLKDVMKEFADLREQFRDEHREVNKTTKKRKNFTNAQGTGKASNIYFQSV